MPQTQRVQNLVHRRDEPFATERTGSPIVRCADHNQAAGAGEQGYLSRAKQRLGNIRLMGGEDGTNVSGGDCDAILDSLLKLHPDVVA